MSTTPLNAKQLIALAHCIDRAHEWRGALPPEERDELEDHVTVARAALTQLYVQRLEGVENAFGPKV